VPQANPDAARPCTRGGASAHRAPQCLIDGSAPGPYSTRNELVVILPAQPALAATTVCAPHQTGAAAHRARRHSATRSHYERRHNFCCALRLSITLRPPRKSAAAYKQRSRWNAAVATCKTSLGLRRLPIPPPRGDRIPRPHPLFWLPASHPRGPKPRDRRHLAQPTPLTRPHAPWSPRQPTAASRTPPPSPATRNHPRRVRPRPQSTQITSTSHPSIDAGPSPTDLPPARITGVVY